MKAYAQQMETDSAALVDEAEVARLVENYIPLVIHQVDRSWLSSRLSITREDLISAGC